MAIHLGRPLPGASRDRPGRRRENPPACPLLRKRQRAAVPTWSCSRWGLPCRLRHRRRGALLPPRFALAGTRRLAGGLLSVALSLGSPPPGVTRHRVSLEPGLSSPRSSLQADRAEGSHPAVWHPRGWPSGQAESRLSAGGECQQVAQQALALAVGRAVDEAGTEVALEGGDDRGRQGIVAVAPLDPVAVPSDCSLQLHYRRLRHAAHQHRRLGRGTKAALGREAGAVAREARPTKALARVPVGSGATSECPSTSVD